MGAMPAAGVGGPTRARVGPPVAGILRRNAEERSPRSPPGIGGQVARRGLLGAVPGGKTAETPAGLGRWHLPEPSTFVVQGQEVRGPVAGEDTCR